MPDFVGGDPESNANTGANSKPGSADVANTEPKPYAKSGSAITDEPNNAYDSYYSNNTAATG